ncbi:hypothetical protein [Providencia sp.]|uniref:hypothetical protein n=1 Tax=Providencia sp. TaxID=589 RepID=UPI000E8A0D05|nr:hypothetical protein [Providencia sp.]MBP6080545.1 hypothetical protein [Providencia sp.]HBO22853.1 hypothetical protein [Providencia sp.]
MDFLKSDSEENNINKLTNIEIKLSDLEDKIKQTKSRIEKYKEIFEVKINVMKEQIEKYKDEIIYNELCKAISNIENNFTKNTERLHFTFLHVDNFIRRTRSRFHCKTDRDQALKEVSFDFNNNEYIKDYMEVSIGNYHFKKKLPEELSGNVNKIANMNASLKSNLHQMIKKIRQIEKEYLKIEAGKPYKGPSYSNQYIELSNDINFLSRVIKTETDPEKLDSLKAEKASYEQQRIKIKNSLDNAKSKKIFARDHREQSFVNDKIIYAEMLSSLINSIDESEMLTPNNKKILPEYLNNTPLIFDFS